MSSTRRKILTLGAVALGGMVVTRAVPALLPPPRFDFSPVDRPKGFRRIARADGLSAGNIFFGLEGDASPPTLSDARICDLVFGGQDTGPGKLAIAVFSDFFCPYCRVLDLQVRELAMADPRVTVVPHEVPLLGVPSQLAARAVLAAQNQGAYEAFHARLIRTDFVPNPAYLRDLAEAEGLDVARFSQDMRSENTDQLLRDSAALFRAFGFVGTPALAIGGTLVNGAISKRELKGLIKLELAAEAPIGCG